MYPVGHGLDQSNEEGRCDDAVGLLDQLDEGEFGGAVNGHEEVEFAFGGLHVRDVDVEVADRVAPELLLRRLVTLIRQARDVVTLWAACNDERVRCGMVGWSA